MFIQRIISKGKKGQIYTSVLLRSTSRVGSRVVSTTLAVLTKLPEWLLNVVETSLAHGPQAGSIEQLVALDPKSFELKVAESFGSIHLVHEVAKQAGIPQALGSGTEAKLLLWQSLARVLAPATSLLGMVRMVSGLAMTALLRIKNTFTEDDLYATGEWAMNNQARVETELWNGRTQPGTGLFFYDVTSSYFEGQCNELAAFGYNRDKISGKKQVVMGLLTDSDGDPISVQLFPGNTNDLATFKDQVDKVKTQFQQKEVTMVGDRGMIRSPQQKQVNDAGMHYISALHKCEIETLLKGGQLQMDLFDITLAETVIKDGRRVVTRRNPQRKEEIQATRQAMKSRLVAWIKTTNIYLAEHPKAKPATQLKHGLAKLGKGNLKAWLSLEAVGRELVLSEDAAAYAEHSKLDGCYAIVSDLKIEQASTEELHDSYKNLSKVESDFRTLKHGHLEIRPWHVRSEENTRAHAFTAMLALKIRRRLEKAWSPLNITVEEGLAELNRLCVLELKEKASGASVTRILPIPSDLQAKLLAAAGVEMPTAAPERGVPVATRVKLEDRRKKIVTV